MRKIIRRQIMIQKPAVFSKKRILSLWFCLTLLLAVLLPVSAFAAETGKKIVRVGWFESTFNMTDQYGRRSGYAYEYQQKIAAYTGWEYQYVTSSWPQLLEMLKKGEIDLLSDVSYTEDRAQSMLYSSLPMGEEEFYAYIASRNMSISMDDYTTFNGKKIGVNKGSVQAQLFAEWARQYGINADVVELTSVQQDAVQKLIYGELDVYISADVIKADENIASICKIGSSHIYFAVNQNRPDLKKELDAAMNRIHDVNRYYNEQLFEKYVKRGRTSSFLTLGERKWLLQRNGIIRVGYRADYNPYCEEDKEKKQLTGALQEYLDAATGNIKNAKIYFEPVAYPTINDALNALRKNEVDCVFPVNMTDYEGERINVILTDPPMHSVMLAIVRETDQKKFSLRGSVNVAVSRGDHYHENFLKQHFPKWKIMYFNNADECLQAVAGGRADCCLISMYRFNRIADQCEKLKLTSQSTGEDMNLSFALRRDDLQLYSVLNKTVGLVSPEVVYSALAAHSYEDKKVTIKEFVKDNLAVVVSVIAVATAIFLALMLRSAKAEKKATERQRLISVAEHDNLSGLYSKNFFREYVSRRLRRDPERKMDFVTLDIEQFLSVNELNGREFADNVLRTLGGEIKEVLSGTRGIACRIEADRFEIFCEQMEDYQALLDRFQAKLNGLSQNANVRLRMGVMPWQKGMDTDLGFNRAWLACNMVRGANRHLMVYNDEMRSREAYNQRLLNDLRRAVEERELKVYYQPKFNIQCEPSRLDSAEALVRWQHPELGLIPPNDFIPLVESNGQIGIIDKYVWAETARQIAAWKEKYGITVPVSVNLSRVDMFDPKLEDILDGLVKENGLSHHCLKLEVTESAYTENVEELLMVMARLRNKGYEIEMDDFGSGYSSLGALSSLPVDVLKMDRSFVMNIDHDEKALRLVELILDIARNLKMPVIAEGVETESQLTLLKSAGCDFVQGYYFSRPLAPEEFETFIVRETGSNEENRGQTRPVPVTE